MDREGGFIKLHRRLRSWPLWRSMTANQRMVWIEILMLANWADDEFWYGTTRVTVKRGQLAHSEDAIAKGAKVGRQIVRDTIAKLIAEGAITREKTLQGNQSPHIITVVNYERFQGRDEDENPHTNQAGTREEPARNQRGTPREEDQEDQEGELFGNGAAAPPPPHALLPLAQGSKPGKRTDPRFGPLRAVWEEEFRTANAGQDYRWQGPADAKGIHRVISVAVEEFRARARRGLRAVGFLRCGTVAKLTSGEVWNQLAGSAPGPPAGKRPGMAPMGSAEAFARDEKPW